jgi:hypothetical protein
MKIHFQQQLGEELLRSERRRIIIVISIVLFLICYRLLEGNVFDLDLETKQVQSVVRLQLHFRGFPNDQTINPSNHPKALRMANQFFAGNSQPPAKFL